MASVFIKYGLRDGIRNITDPVHVRLALEELGPTFIKVGQLLSIRPDIMPEAFIHEFQKLQDNVNPERFDLIAKVIEDGLGQSIDSFFAEFNRTPLAAASLAQVHKAVLKTGQVVAVKIQRPGARERMLADLSILKRLAGIMKFTSQGNIINIKELVEELMSIAGKELDFRNEASNINKFRENNKNDASIICPVVYDEYTRENILIMDFLEGEKIGNTEALKKAGIDLDKLALKLASNYLSQIFEHGFFHADPHPGNILVCKDKIAYLDFGIMGSFPKSLMTKFTQLLHAIISRNIDAITHQLIRIGQKKGHVDIKKLYSDVEEVYNSYIDLPLSEINLPVMMDDMFRTIKKNNIAIPADLAMFIKGTMTMESVVMKLAPDTNFMDIAIPFIRKKTFGKKEIVNELSDQLESIYALSRSGFKIPLKALELTNSLLAGKVKLRLEHTNLDDSISALNKMVNRLVFALIVAAFVVGSSLVIKADIAPKIMGVSAFGFIGYIGAALMGIWLLVSILRSGNL